MLPSVQLKNTQAFQNLASHFEDTKDLQIKDLFSKDQQRFSSFSILWNDILFDYSKNRITKETFDLLFDLANEVKLQEAIEKMFAGDKINATEGRAVLHKKRPTEIGLNYEELAKTTEHYVSSDIKFLCDEASRKALKDNLRITKSILLETIRKNKPSISKTELDSYLIIKAKMDGENNNNNDRPRIGFRT